MNHPPTHDRRPTRSRAQLLAIVLIALAATGALLAPAAASQGPPTRTLTVTLSGAGSGTVTSSPRGITCSSGTCSANFKRKTTVTLTATAGTNSSFSGWGGACSGTATTCTLTLTNSASVTAEFIQTVYFLYAGVNGGGSYGYITGPNGLNCGPTCSTGILAGTSVTVNAWANTGYVFWHWAGDCAAFASNPTCSFTMDSSKSVTAYFAEGTGLCNAQPQTKHSNGLGAYYFDCSALGTPGNASTYTQAMATEAAQAWDASATITAATCAATGDSVVVATDATTHAGATWTYTGTSAGHVRLNSDNAICATTYDLSWN